MIAMQRRRRGSALGRVSSPAQKLQDAIAKIDHHGRDRADLDKDYEHLPEWIGVQIFVEELFKQDEVCGRADGQKLGDAFHNPQHHRKQEVRHFVHHPWQESSGRDSERPTTITSDRALNIRPSAGKRNDEREINERVARPKRDLVPRWMLR